MPDPAPRFCPPTRIGLGGTAIGNMYEAAADAQAQDAIDAAWQAGMRYFDTAPLYGLGLSEHRLGDYLRHKNRDDFVLSTKVGRLLEPGRTELDLFKEPLPFRYVYDYSAAGTRRSIEDSLQRLGMDRIDIVFIHDVGADFHGDRWRERFDTAMEGAAHELTRMREEGLIKAWGLGVNLIEPCLAALERSDPDIFLLATQYSLLNPAAADTLLPACVERGASVVVGAPYNAGFLAGRDEFDYGEAPPEKRRARDRLHALAREHDVDLRAAALQFSAAHPGVAAVIPGTKRPEYARANAELLERDIPAGFWADLRADGVIPEDVPVPN